MAKLLRLAMDRLAVSYEEWPEEHALFGGRALSAEILNREVPPRCEPLGPGAIAPLRTQAVTGGSELDRLPGQDVLSSARSRTYEAFLLGECPALVVPAVSAAVLITPPSSCGETCVGIPERTTWRFSTDSSDFGHQLSHSKSRHSSVGKRKLSTDPQGPTTTAILIKHSLKIEVGMAVLPAEALGA
jgi:hypothetical protein